MGEEDSQTPASMPTRARPWLSKKFRPQEIAECPFANLPEAKSGRWGQGLTKAKMADCRWLKPVLVGQFGSWNGRATTPPAHKIHRLREDKNTPDVRREKNAGVC